MLQSNKQTTKVNGKTERKAEYRPLLLDESGEIVASYSIIHKKFSPSLRFRLNVSGREIDEKGNLVKQGPQPKTLQANVAIGLAKKRVENPYLAHKISGTSSTKAGDETSTIATTSLLPVHIPTILNLLQI